jgi:hypothetical protein
MTEVKKVEIKLPYGMPETQGFDPSKPLLDDEVYRGLTYERGFVVGYVVSYMAGGRASETGVAAALLMLLGGAMGKEETTKVGKAVDDIIAADKRFLKLFEEALLRVSKEQNIDESVK